MFTSIIFKLSLNFIDNRVTQITFLLHFRYFNVSVQDFVVQLDRTFVVCMHKTLLPLLAVFECPLDARFRQDVSSLHAPNIPPVREFKP